MSDFKAKMHQIVCGLWGSTADLVGELTALPRLPSWILGHISKGGEGRGRKGEKQGRGGDSLLSRYISPCHYIPGKGLQLGCQFSSFLSITQSLFTCSSCFIIITRTVGDLIRLKHNPQDHIFLQCFHAVGLVI